jgi:hypothetical protein
MKPQDCTGIRVGGWESKYSTAIRRALDPLPYPWTFAAAAWSIPITKNSPTVRYRWSAGPVVNGDAIDMDDAMKKADTSLREQGFALQSTES